MQNAIISKVRYVKADYLICFGQRGNLNHQLKHYEWNNNFFFFNDKFI